MKQLLKLSVLAFASVGLLTACSTSDISRAIAEHNDGNFDKAEDIYGVLLEANPNDKVALLNQGIAHSVKGEYAEAIENYDKIIEDVDDDYAPAYNNRGVVYYKQEEYNLAVADYNKALEIDDDYASALVNRGWICYDFEQYNGAMSDANLAIERDDEFAPAYLLRGHAQEALGNKDAAIEDYKLSYEYNEDYIPAQEKLREHGIDPSTL